MKKLLVGLIFLSLLLSAIPIYAGSGAQTITNLVAGTSAVSPYYTGASVYVLADTSSSTTPFAVVATDGTSYTVIQGDGIMRQARVWHVYGGFQWQNETISVTGASQWAHVTNAGNNLWSGTEADGFSLSGDVMTFTYGGDYIGSLSITYSGLTGKDFVYRIYNVTQASQQGFLIGASTTGAGNFVNATLPLYIEANAGDQLRVEVTCVTDGSDPTLINAVFYIAYLHD